MEEGGGRVGGCEVGEARGEWGGGGLGGVRVRVGEREDTGDVAGVGAEVEDVGEVAVDVLRGVRG